MQRPISAEQRTATDSTGKRSRIFGGSAEYVALWFKEQGHEPYFYWYVTACILMPLLVYLFMKDTKATSGINDDIGGASGF